jgi:hypothetical protein
MRRGTAEVPAARTRRGRALLAAIALAALAAGPAARVASGGERGARADRTVPPPNARWQYQLQASQHGDSKSGRVDVDICSKPFSGGPGCVRPKVIDFDLYLPKRHVAVDSTPNRRAVRALHRRGGYAICYVDAGSIESYRPDYQRFVRWHRHHGRSLLGNPFSPIFNDERWANIGGKRQRAFLLRRMGKRVAKCRRAGFDAVEFDVVDGWEAPKRVTGWRISYRDQISYNRSLARIGHRNGLAVGLKNDLGQIPDLIHHFDFAINEQCFQYHECNRLEAFVDAGKPVFQVEYRRTPAQFCPRAAALGFNAIRKAQNFSLHNEPYRPCS